MGVSYKKSLVSISLDTEESMARVCEAEEDDEEPPPEEDGLLLLFDGLF